MRVCLDTNIVVQIFGQSQPFRPIRDALVNGRIELAVSNEILLEYEEVITRLCGGKRWLQIEALFTRLFQLHANILFLDPQFRFRVIAGDPDDDKFVDCAIAAQADFIVTEDRDFQALLGSGYKPKPISPSDFVQLLLTK